MQRFEIKMPKLGESITEGTILSWSVKEGDMIHEDDVLFEVNTAKVSAEIPSPVAGKIAQILFKEGDTVAVGVTVAIVEMEGEESDTAPEVVSALPIPPSAAPVAEERRWYSPVVMKLAAEAKLPQEELDAIVGTGFEGRLSKRDIQRYLAQKSQPTVSAPIAAPAEPSYTPIPTAPTLPPRVPVLSTAQQPTPATSGVEVTEMDRVRRIIADHMVMSKHTSPHVTNVIEVDMTALVHWRETHKEEFFRQEGVKLTYMPAITQAVAAALKQYPQVNASVEGYNILLKKNINVGIAVAQNDGNLIVPVIGNADRLNLAGLAVAIDRLAQKARVGKLSADDISGGTFTITNFGSFGSLLGTPIINQPQVAILGVGVIEKRPSVIETPLGDTIGIRHKMYLSLSYDHRIVDGALGGQFLYAIKKHLETSTL